MEVVRRAGIAHTVHRYDAPEPHGRARDDRPSYGIDAAIALGVPPARVFKTLVASVDGRTVLAVVPVDGELDLKRLAAACSGRRAVLVRPGGCGASDGLRHRRDQPAGAASSAADRDR